MSDNIFESIFTYSENSLSVQNFLICVLCALASGLITAFAYSVKSRTTRSFSLTLVMLPSIVCVVIMLVNGNIGAGVATAGAFSLVRFRSAQGSAKEITMLFLAMGAGLVFGMGYIFCGLLYTALLCLIYVILNVIGIGDTSKNNAQKTLTITVPENLDFDGVFEPVLNKYTSSHSLNQVKTTNMGSMFRLRYDVRIKEMSKVKELLDELRVLNGNLEVMLGDYIPETGEL
ncbi:MAG: DUF4956 domain-containing protein [Clostridiales bacterium]|nr:DUF4956 domain-containing protein [Clostridiales bacterium]